MEKVSRRKFVASAAVAGAAAVLRPAFAFDNQGPGAAATGAVNHEVMAPQASPFPMKSVRLQPGALSSAAEANRKYLKTLPPDGLLHTFRLTAGLFLQHGVKQFKAAITVELLTLCELGAADVLLAHSPLGAKQKRVTELARQYRNTKISVIVESAEGAKAWDGLPVGMFVDINPGMNRTGVPTDQVLAVLAAVGGFREIHYYDGHISSEAPRERARLAHLGYTKLMLLISRLQSFGIAVPEVITSGTPTFPCAVSFPGFIEGLVRSPGFPGNGRLLRHDNPEGGTHRCGICSRRPCAVDSGEPPER